MDIIQVNINRYARKYNRYKLGLLDTSCGIYNDLVSNSKKIYSTYNIERPSKFFYIQTISRKSSEISSREAREELKKNFDNKASILLNGEHFLVCEIEINREGNKKFIT